MESGNIIYINEPYLVSFGPISPYPRFLNSPCAWDECMHVGRCWQTRLTLTLRYGKTSLLLSVRIKYLVGFCGTGSRSGSRLSCDFAATATAALPFGNQTLVVESLSLSQMKLIVVAVQHVFSDASKIFLFIDANSKFHFAPRSRR